MAQDPSPGRVHPTKARLLLSGAGAGLVLGWFGGALAERALPVAPSVPWTSVLVLLFAAAVLGWGAWSTWNTVHRRRERMDPHRAVYFLVLAKASSLVGSLVAGVYLGYGARFLDDLSAPLPQERVLRAALVVAAAALVVATALLLERACRVPRPPDADQDGAAPGRAAGSADGRNGGHGDDGGRGGDAHGGGHGTGGTGRPGENGSAGGDQPDRRATS